MEAALSHIENSHLPLEKLLYSTATIADLLDLPRTRVLELMRSGRINAVRCGRRTLVHRNEVLRFASEMALAADQGSHGQL